MVELIKYLTQSMIQEINYLIAHLKDTIQHSRKMGNVCTTVETEATSTSCPHQINFKQKKKGINSEMKQQYICPICQEQRESEEFERHEKKEMNSLISLTTQNGDNASLRGSARKVRMSNKIKKTINDFQVVRGLGRGAFGKVYLIKQKQQQDLKAYPNTDIMSIDKQQFESRQQQIAFQLQLQEGDRRSHRSHIENPVQHCQQSSDQSTSKRKEKQSRKSRQIEQSLPKIEAKPKQTKYFALKIMNKQKISSKQQKKQALLQRCILESMDHPFIVKLHYAFQTTSRLFIIVDLLQGGELFFLLRKMKKFDEVTAKFYAAQILLAMEYLHNKSIIYRDLKPENILLDSEGHLKITDFGLSKIMYSTNQKTYSLCGTPQYIAPEVITGKGYTQAADWFSYGSLIYDMLTGRPPFLSNNKGAMLKNLVTKAVPLPYYISNQAKSLLNGLFKIKPQERLGSKGGASQIKNHPFFKSINFDDLYQRKIKPPISIISTDSNQKLEGQQIYLNSAGFEKWGSWQMGMESPTPKKRKESRELYQGFTYANGGLEEEQQIPEGEEEYEEFQG